jgi:hypothetical protein
LSISVEGIKRMDFIKVYVAFLICTTNTNRPIVSTGPLLAYLLYS